MRVLFINNDGGGFADHIDIADGTTVQQLFDQRLAQRKPADYLIRVNRQPTTSDAVLQPGDRISITPTKIEGAASGGISRADILVCSGISGAGIPVCLSHHHHRPSPY